MVNETAGDFDGGMKQMSAVGGKKGCRARKQERQTRGIAALTLFRTAVPFGGQTTDNLGRLSPKGDCGSKQNGKTVDTSKGKGEDFCYRKLQAVGAPTADETFGAGFEKEIDVWARGERRFV